VPDYGQSLRRCLCARQIRPGPVQILPGVVDTRFCRRRSGTLINPVTIDNSQDSISGIDNLRQSAPCAPL